jgi:hypothetical protein
MARLLCLFGLHKWRPYKLRLLLVNLKTGEPLSPSKRCIRCGKDKWGD